MVIIRQESECITRQLHSGAMYASVLLYQCGSIHADDFVLGESLPNQFERFGILIRLSVSRHDDARSPMMRKLA